MTPAARKPSARDALLEGAIICLRERGFARTTARDVVAAAGVNLGAIGYHYGSMESLLSEAITTLFRQWLARAQRIAARSDATFEDLLVAFGEEAVREFPHERHLGAAFLEGVAQGVRSPELRERMAADFRVFHSLVEAMLTARLGELTGSDGTAGVASVLIALDVGLMVQALIEPEREFAPNELVTALATLCRVFDSSPPRGSDPPASGS